MLRQIVCASAIFGLTLVSVTAPASAQAPNPNLAPGIDLNPRKQLTPEQIEKQKATDEAYNAAMKKIPDKKSSADPWGDIRPNTTVKNKPQQPQ